MPLLIHLKPRQAPVTIHNLALLLEIDLLVMNDKKSFEGRLDTAISDAYRQGFRKRKRNSR